MGFTKKEKEVMDSLANAWNKFCELNQTHPMDKDEFCAGIHECQKTLSMRILRREHPEQFPTYKGSFNLTEFCKEHFLRFQSLSFIICINKKTREYINLYDKQFSKEELTYLVKNMEEDPHIKEE